MTSVADITWPMSRVIKACHQFKPMASMLEPYDAGMSTIARHHLGGVRKTYNLEVGHVKGRGEPQSGKRLPSYYL
jgi:hypothetical protein